MREPGLCITAIVWIARLCVAYSAELIIKCLNVLRVNHLPFYVIKFHLASEGELEKKVFMVVTNSSHNY